LYILTFVWLVYCNAVQHSSVKKVNSYLTFLRNPLKSFYETNEMTTKRRKEEEQGDKIKVDGTEVLVKTSPPSKVRPVHYCQTCDVSFPSQLDLDEQINIDHKKKNNSSSNKKGSVIA